jgi:hypothetical protein
MKIINTVIEKIFFIARIFKFRLKIHVIKSNHKNLFKKIDKDNELKHKQLWRQLFPLVDGSWLRFYSNVTGYSDYKYVPEDIFYSIIERKLNDVNYSAQIANKASYDVVFDKKLFPENYLKNLSGIYLDSNNKIITTKKAKEIFNLIKDDYIVKPAVDSWGGKNVLKVKPERKKLTLKQIEKIYSANFLIQKVIKHHDFFSSFNKSSVNTFRVFTYRSVISEKIHVLHVILKLGRKDFWVDNSTVGGISVKADTRTGKLAKFAVTNKGEKFTKHPDSKMIFFNQKVPYLSKIIETAKLVSSKIPTHRLISYDITVDFNENVKIIEINSVGVGINLIQLHGSSLFQNHTQEIINYCKLIKSDQFQYIRMTK